MTLTAISPHRPTGLPQVLHGSPISINGRGEQSPVTPDAATFGQWSEHLKALLGATDFKDWASTNRIDLSKPITLFPARDGKPGYAALRLKPSAIANNREPFTEYFGAFAGKAPRAVPQSWPLILQAAAVLANGQTYIFAPTGATHGPQADQPAPATNADLEHQQAKMGDITNRHAFCSQLVGDLMERYASLLIDAQQQAALPTTATGYLSPEGFEARIKHIIERCLEDTHMPVDASSSYARERGLAPGSQVSLKRFIEDTGWLLPTTYEALRNLYTTATAPMPASPAHGDLGGALSWPVPLDDPARRDLYYHPLQTLPGVEDHGLFKLLTRNQAWDKTSLAEPRRIIEHIIASPAGQAVGEGLQLKYGTLTTPTSQADWLLAALQLSLDQESLLESSPTTARTSVAGFDLAAVEHIGKHPATVVQALADQLLDKQRTTAELAPVAAHFLLSRRAPAYLVKDIPAGVTVGSHSWLRLEVAVARLEARAPGSSALTFAEVMKSAEHAPITAAEQAAESAAQQTALIDWGVANGVIRRNSEDHYPELRMAEVRAAFNVQITALSEGSAAFASKMPTRREIALKHLRHALGDGVPLEEACLTPVVHSRDYPGPYSLLDIYLKQGSVSGVGTSWISSSKRVTAENTRTAYALPDANAEFPPAFAQFREKMDNAIATQTKHLITRLPLDDRQHIESGKLTLVKNISIRRTPFGITGEDRSPNEHSLLLKTEHKGEVRTYLLNRKDNTLEKTQLGDVALGKEYDSNGHHVRTYEEVGSSPATASASGIPASFTSARSAWIADAMVKDANIEGYQDQARGLTTFESEVPFYKKGRDILLNMIPLRSAIKHFSEGNIGEGIIDLTFDAFGFMLGASAAARGVKALQAGASVGARITQGARIIGRTAAGVLNPLDGVGSLALGLVRGGQKGALGTLHALRLLNGSADSYDLIKASRHFDASAIGTFKRQGEIVQAPAVLTQGKWYAFDTLRGHPFGKALDDFQPSMRTGDQALGKWETSVPVPNLESKRILEDWTARVAAEKNGPGVVAFQGGYTNGNPATVPGYRATMKSEDVMKLGRNAHLTPAEIGTLARQQERLAVQHGLKGASRFYESISSAGGTFIPAPQVLYLSQTNPLSGGQCAAMSRLMAQALEQGKEATFINNLFTAAANPTADASRQFIGDLRAVQKQVEGPTLFHAARPRQQMDCAGIVTELSNAQGTKMLMIASPDHAMMAGVVGEGLNKQLYFYDPNFGLATFSSPEAMRRGLDKVFADKALPVQYKTHSRDANRLEFEVSSHDGSWKQTTSVPDKTVKDLTEVPILINATPLTPPSVPRKPVVPPAPASTKKAETIEVSMGHAHTLTDPASILSTNSLSDCSAVAVLSGLKNGVYRKRTLVHLTGSNLDSPVNNAGNGFAWLESVKKDLDGGGKIIFVGGVDTKSVVGVAAVLGQQNSLKKQPLLELLQRDDVSVVYASSAGVEVYPDGTFKLREHDGAGVFSDNKINEIMDFAKD